jgi:asparagine synthase (glutamine-hydrolysing)
MLRRYNARRESGTDSTSPVAQVEKLTPREWRVYEIRELTLPRLLKWDDRNFMAFSVEGRYPFLDHKLIDLCLSFAPSTLYDRGWTKEPLRLGFSELLPPEITRRKSKIGFEPPQGRWLMGTLRPLIDAVLRRDAAVHHFADYAIIRDLAQRVIATQASSREDHQALMRILFVDRWLRRFKLV